MLPFRPRSIKQLTVTGFLAVAGVLVIALIISARQISGLSAQSQLTLNNTPQAMETARDVIEQASAMERNARQFQIVGDQEIFNMYLEPRRILDEAVQRFQSLQLDTGMNTPLAELFENEEADYALQSRADFRTAAAINQTRPLLDLAYSRLQDIR